MEGAKRRNSEGLAVVVGYLSFFDDFELMFLIWQDLTNYYSVGPLATMLAISTRP